jgi:hypothetical protein
MAPRYPLMSRTSSDHEVAASTSSVDSLGEEKTASPSPFRKRKSLFSSILSQYGAATPASDSKNANQSPATRPSSLRNSLMVDKQFVSLAVITLPETCGEIREEERADFETRLGAACEWTSVESAQAALGTALHVFPAEVDIAGSLSWVFFTENELNRKLFGLLMELASKNPAKFEINPLQFRKLL